tara:strand:- start:154 stop:1380 length:1227 start_codon:yes stop_codon:yes gene_type:complete
MSFKKFGPNSVFTNTMRAYPSNEFVIFNSKVFWNSVPEQSGTRNPEVRNVPAGHVSLYEYNIDRPEVNTGRSIGSGSIADNGRIYPWISKDTAGASFKTVSKTTYQNEFAYGDILTSKYPLSASIIRELITTPYANTASYNQHYVSMRNRLNYYGAISPHYKVTSSFGNKDTQTLNLISIPSIFFGSQIKPGTMSLKWYFTGSLIAELQDIRQNGELVQVGPKGSTGSGSIAGVALYNEGFVMLTGSWSLHSTTIRLTTGSFAVNPKWIYFGAGAQDGITTTTAGATYSSASFSLSFKGTTETQVMTMLAYAARNRVNYSNNPTFLKHNQSRVYYTSSQVYEQPNDIQIKNTVSSAFDDYEVAFKRQVYISRVGIYDKNKNLIGVATLSNPVRKEEDRDYMFKLKLDI